MTAPVPGLSDERLAEIEADHDSFRVMVDHNASTCPKCSLLREVAQVGGSVMTASGVPVTPTIREMATDG